MAKTERQDRGYDVGVQLFNRICESGAVYIDKTEYVWKMVTSDVVNFFLSRPRRFGKSLLADTLRCYFEGQKELFESGSTFRSCPCGLRCYFEGQKELFEGLFIYDK